MKHLLIIVAALFTFSAFAQDHRNDERHKKSPRLEFTPEQIATLKTKRLALSLDLSESQKQKIHKLTLKKAQLRKEKRSALQKNGKSKAKLSSDQLFKIANTKLDRAIAHQQEMKSILNKLQFDKWQKGVKKRKIMKRRHPKRKRMLSKRNRIKRT